MVEHTRLLPQNATPWELLTARVMDPLALLAEEFDGIRIADESPPPQFMPFLIWERGLGELSPYIPNLYELVDEGVRWQRVRGTPAAIARGVGWLGYGATLEENPPRRRWWSKFQIELDRVRDDELPDLRRLDGIIQLSPPQRSYFVRGFRGYDIRAGVLSYSRLSACGFSDFSGVRIDPGRAKWSFGRAYSHEQLVSVATLYHFGVWSPPQDSAAPWTSVNVEWDTIDEPWNSPLSALRRANIYAGLSSRTIYVRFRRANGSIIGSVLPVVRPVKSADAGEYQIEGRGAWAVAPDDMTHMLVRGLTPFDVAAGEVSSSIEVVVDAARASGVPAGRAWLGPADLTGGRVVASFDQVIEFGRTVRERVNFLLALDGNYPLDMLGDGTGAVLGAAPGVALGTWSMT